MGTQAVISGSFRKHLDEIGIALEAFREAGIEVLAPATKDAVNSAASFVLLSTDDSKKSADVLEKEFMSKIEKIDFLYVANVGGYVGKSVAAEMSFASIHHIPIVMAEEINQFSEEISLSAQTILKTSAIAYLPIDSINSFRVADLNLQSSVPRGLSLEQKANLNSLIDNLLEELKHVKI
ncbi:MAG: hypothetical protein WC666_03715 [Candidatus Paceibacterota bacterium]|jgi:hypothetical protein